MKDRLATKLERKRLGRIVRVRREELRLTLRELSAESGVALGALSQLEWGHNFSVHTLIRVCDTLDLRIVVFAEGAAGGLRGVGRYFDATSMGRAKEEQ